LLDALILANSDYTNVLIDYCKMSIFKIFISKVLCEVRIW